MVFNACVVKVWEIDFHHCEIDIPNLNFSGEIFSEFLYFGFRNKILMFWKDLINRVPSGQGKPGKPGKRAVFRKSQGKPGKVREFL